MLCDSTASSIIHCCPVIVPAYKRISLLHDAKISKHIKWWIMSFLLMKSVHNFILGPSSEKSVVLSNIWQTFDKLVPWLVVVSLFVEGILWTGENQYPVRFWIRVSTAPHMVPPILLPIFPHLLNPLFVFSTIWNFASKFRLNNTDNAT